ncbi:MAG: aspartate-semialdehyde dehydrogenase [Bacteroidales bacterium]
MKVAVVGATGLVGQVMLKVLEERNFPVKELIPVASERSIGKKVSFKGSEYSVITAQQAIYKQPDIALFSAGASTSLKWAPKFAEAGCKVIDNSSAWRTNKNIQLIVPEVNGKAIRKEDMIIANPNCSTIQLVMAIFPIHRDYSIKRLIISTYQSVSGSGINGIQQLNDERCGKNSKLAYPHCIDKNVLPHGGDFLQDNYTSEEEKLKFETRKILNTQNIGISATVVRVPVQDCHSESVNLELSKAFKMEQLISSLNKMPGLIVKDEPENNIYPMPANCADKDDVFVGRIRRDDSIESGLNLWIVADNLRKGAATNAVQIAQYLLEHKLI